MASEIGREMLLKKVVSKLSADVVLIDCPPSLGLLTVNALTCADFLLIPVQTEYYALEGISQLLQIMQRVQSSLNPDLKIVGVLLTMYDSRTSLSGQVQEELNKHFGNLVSRQLCRVMFDLQKRQVMASLSVSMINGQKEHVHISRLLRRF